MGVMELVIDDEDKGGDWVALMAERGKLGRGGVRAAQEIRRVMTPGGGVGPLAADAGLRAVDPSRLNVDGGKFSLGNLGAGHAGFGDDGSLLRWEAYCRAVVARADGTGSVKGRGKDGGQLRRDILLVRLLVHGCRPRALDRELGVRAGTCQDAALAELNAYATMHHFFA